MPFDTPGHGLAASPPDCFGSAPSQPALLRFWITGYLLHLLLHAVGFYPCYRVEYVARKRILIIPQKKMLSTVGKNAQRLIYAGDNKELSALPVLKELRLQVSQLPGRRNLPAILDFHQNCLAVVPNKQVRQAIPLRKESDIRPAAAKRLNDKCLIFINPSSAAHELSDNVIR